jgi:tetratricopeptide (TPR) repeat protein
MYTRQIAVIGIVVALMAYLLFQPVRGLIKPKPDRTKNSAMVGSSKQETTGVTVESVSKDSKNAIGASLSGEITKLEEKFKSAGSEPEKLALEKQLAKHWDDVNQPGAAAFYYQLQAQQENTVAGWLTTGNRFNDALAVTKDSVLQAAFVNNSADAFQHALKLQPGSLEAKTGLGIAYVNGAASPMQGIALLLEVVKQEPNNVSANLNLGMFSMRSRQFDKAVNRFKTVIAARPNNVEAYFNLAESYKQLGMKTEAIAAYEKCKQLMADPVADKRLDEYIKELKN